MQETITPYKNSEKSKKEQVEGMFSSISPKYDALNRIMTLKMDTQWRKNVRKKVAEIQPLTILDVATGTGDLAIELTKIPNAQITGLDLSSGMLVVGRKKIAELGLTNRIEMIQGDSENLPFDDETFDAVTVSFGVRNFENLEKGLSQIRRVLRPKGRLVVLETSVPEKFPFKQGYKLYTRFVIPLLGKWFANDSKAYAYLSESASRFPYGERFAEILQKVGFSKVTYQAQTLGVATIYIAER